MNVQNPEKLAKLQALSASVRTGGKGSVRRKRKVQHKTGATDDKKLQSSLKKLGVQPIGGIEEVNLFRADGQIVHFKNPKVQVAIQSNTFVISGPNETKSIKDLLPGIITQLSPDHLTNLRDILGQVEDLSDEKKDGDDDDVPDLVENVDFEKTAGQ
eukprot:c39446_g1_i1.p1 GENE.c39446_g1_i1~~c39446_g1_i1.p1  ORF type:complete len:157 (+),score=47.91 c39446_g1_i1:56-526(+)